VNPPFLVVMQASEHTEWQPPDWWYRGSRPSSGNCYFENMCRVIFQAGLNWQVVDRKWPTIKEVFLEFDIGKVAVLTEEDAECLLRDRGVIRNRGKINAVIRNAQTFLAIEQQCGSFKNYIDSVDRADNYAKVVKLLVNNFKWLGPPSASTFLYTVGEDISVWGH
jgi:DNA-3-methyladenine glycosylase I